MMKSRTVVAINDAIAIIGSIINGELNSIAVSRARVILSGVLVLEIGRLHEETMIINNEPIHIFRGDWSIWLTYGVWHIERSGIKIISDDQDDFSLCDPIAQLTGVRINRIAIDQKAQLTVDFADNYRAVCSVPVSAIGGTNRDLWSISKKNQWSMSIYENGNLSLEEY